MTCWYVSVQWCDAKIILAQGAKILYTDYTECFVLTEIKAIQEYNGFTSVKKQFITEYVNILKL